MVFVEHNCAVDVKPLIEWSRMAWFSIPSCFCRCSSWFLRWGRWSLKVEFFQTSERSERVRWKNETFNDSLPHWKNQLEHLQKQRGTLVHASLEHKISGLTFTAQLCSTNTIPNGGSTTVKGRFSERVGGAPRFIGARPLYTLFSYRKFL